MLILLPPSETKTPGGQDTRLSVPSLRFSALASQRDLVVDALVTLSQDPAEAKRVLKLGDRLASEVETNALIRTSPTMPAIDRYTGVLFDAIDVGSLPHESRAWMGEHVVIHSAPFALVSALDAIPSYRLGASASLPGTPSLKRIWSDAVSAALLAESPGYVLDLRSEAYVSLGPVPDALRSDYVRVVTRTEDGHTRALNHFNKKAKGVLVRALARDRPSVSSADDLLSWGESAGFVFRRTRERELELEVPVSA